MMKSNIILKTLTITLVLVLKSTLSFADGFIVMPRPRPQIRTAFPLEVKYHHVDVKINNQNALTKIDQKFYNPTRYRLEGYYIFPIPKNAIIRNFTMFINGKEIKAELLNSKKARKIYEDIVRRHLDPALLEYQNNNIFKVRIFPIEPRSTKRIKISYSQVLIKDNNTMEYIYPLNTEKFSSKPLKEVSINTEIISNEKIKNVYCTSHDSEIIRKGEKKAIISYEKNNVKPDRDYKLYYSTSKSKIGISLLRYKEKNKEGFFFLNASPGIDYSKNEISEKDITFVLDVSGSMAGEKLKQAKKSLLFCIENLNKGDRFQIIKFSTEAEALFKDMQKANKRNLQSARKYISEFKAIGGTNIEEALQMSLSQKTSKNRPYLVIFITDGKPTIGETGEKKLLKKVKQYNSNKTRIYTFGIGYDINTHLLDGITGITKAYRSYISPNEDIEVKISNFYTKVKSPVLTDIKVQFTNVKASKMYPGEIPDLFKGSSLSLIGRYRGSGKAKIIISGKIKDKLHKFKYDITLPAQSNENEFIPPLWASRRIGYLLDQIRLNGESKEVIDEITALAREYGIVTPYTSYLILEDERIKVSRGEIKKDDLTLGNMNKRSKVLMKKSKSEYKIMMDKSGEGSVRASEEVQNLNKAYNFSQTRQGINRLNDKTSGKKRRTMSQQVRNIQGRAMYQTGKYWVDSRLQKKRAGKKIRIRFASKAYFNMLRNNPDSAKFMSLGRNIRFIYKNKVYEIYE